MTIKEFEALAERILHSVIRKNNGYTPPGNAHMLVDTALAITEDFAEKLRLRREEIQQFDGLTAEEVEALRDGNKIRAIKLVRERTGMNLKDAKQHVDKLEQQMEQQ